MRHWRERQVERGLAPLSQSLGLKVWGFFAERPTLYRLATRIAMPLLARLGHANGRFDSLPFAQGWTESRDFPAPQGETFQAQWQKRLRAKAGEARP